MSENCMSCGKPISRETAKEHDRLCEECDNDFRGNLKSLLKIAHAEVEKLLTAIKNISDVYEGKIAVHESMIEFLREELRTNSSMLAKLHDTTIPEEIYKKANERIVELETELGELIDEYSCSEHFSKEKVILKARAVLENKVKNSDIPPPPKPPPPPPIRIIKEGQLPRKEDY